MQNTFEDIFQRKSDHIKPGLQRMQTALNLLPNLCHWEIPTILVGGTNGKGSVSAFLWRMLKDSGYKPGLYTSPHVVHFEERFVAGHEIVKHEDLLSLLRQLQKELPENIYTELSFFEISTLLALLFFKDKGTDINVVEVGLGGRFDATNALNPLISIITSIDFDHEMYLGSDLFQIFREKLGIARIGKPLILGALESLERRKLQEICSEINQSGIHLKMLGKDFGLKHVGAESFYFEGHPEKLVRLPNYFATYPQYKQNAYLLAYRAYLEFQRQKLPADTRENDLLDKHYMLIHDNPKGRSLPNCYLGRFQSLEVKFENQEGSSETADFILDVAHNPAGVTALIKVTQQTSWYRGKKKHGALVSILKDKDYPSMLHLLMKAYSPIIFFTCNTGRALDIEQLRKTHKESLILADSFATAIKLYIENKFRTHDPWIICGSVYAIGEVIQSLNAYPEHGFFTEKDILHGRYLIS